MDLNLDDVSGYFKDNTEIPEEFYENIVKASNIYKAFNDEASKGRVLKNQVKIPIKNDKHELELVIKHPYSFSDNIDVLMIES